MVAIVDVITSGSVGTLVPYTDTNVIDDWRIYHRKLDSNDVRTLYNY